MKSKEHEMDCVPNRTLFLLTLVCAECGKEWKTYKWDFWCPSCTQKKLSEGTIPA